MKCDICDWDDEGKGGWVAHIAQHRREYREWHHLPNDTVRYRNTNVRAT
jgi:hypothetical protein